MAALRSRLSRVAGPLTALRLIGQGGEFLAFVVLARRLGTTGFGEVTVAYLICRYGGLLADWGASLQGTRDVAAGSHPDALHELVRRRNIATTALTVFFVLGAWATGHGALAPLALTIVGRGLGRDWLALGEEKGVTAGLPSAVQGATAVVFCLLVDSVTGAASAIGAAYAVAARWFRSASSRCHPAPRGSPAIGRRSTPGSWS